MKGHLRIAREIVRLAKELVADEQNEINDNAVADDGAIGEIAKRKREIESNLETLHNELYTAMKERMDAYTNATALYKSIVDSIKSEYKKFCAETGWDKAMKACEKEIAAFEKLGGVVGDINSKFIVASDQSLQPSYKEWLLWVINEFDNSEFQSYVSKLDTFKKNTVKLRTGCSLFDSEVKQWKDEAQRLYQENGMKLPTASVKNAGMLSDIVDSLVGMFRKIVDKVKTVYDELVDKFSDSADDATASVNALEKLSNAYAPDKAEE